MSKFSSRHIGPSAKQVEDMLNSLGFPSLDSLVDQAIPEAIRVRKPLELPAARSEEKALEDLAAMMAENEVYRSNLGMGYSPCHVPAAIRRNILENPGWYTAYTPYQAEIAQGRLEALLNFQTMICDLTGMEIANASLLDEPTAVAEAIAMAHGIKRGESIFVADDCHPQTLQVVCTRAEALDIEVIVGPVHALTDQPVFAAVLQYPATDGVIHRLEPLIRQIHEIGALAIVSADLLALTLIKPPGEAGADIVVGSAQRFGVPLGFGGPHAAYLATRDAHKRRLPGRLVGVSKDATGKSALRLTLQTREQHIRRDKATSNICTAQVLLAVMASMYAVYHGPDGLKEIAERTHSFTTRLADALKRTRHNVHPGPYFDTIRVGLTDITADELLEEGRKAGINIRKIDERTVSVALDETTDEIESIAEVFGSSIYEIPESAASTLPNELLRKSAFLAHPVFNSYHTETELMRYMRRLESKDLSLTTSMIPLGSCTMKLNAASEMLAVTWPCVSWLHPYAPEDQTGGYTEMANELQTWLGEITGLPCVSLQPNAGSQGEFAGLLAIRGYHLANGDSQRNICLIPTSAHGTNPASAVMAGMQVVTVKCLADGDIDDADLRAKIEKYPGQISALMITYPSTHGVFEPGIKDICELIHEAGGQVYMDGANMNAQVGLTSPQAIGADVCHLNLHKTFCIPHGGGGPGIGPICAAKHRGDFLPGNPLAPTSSQKVGPVAAADLGSASILVIPWMYLAMMGPDGLTEATKVAILNANYIAARLGDAFPILFRGNEGLIAHECILDVREWKEKVGIDVEDIAKRLMDFGFHAPTMSWPVPGTLMVEPTESESQPELDRFCDAMLAIRAELDAIAEGKLNPQDNPLKNAPHTAREVTATEWVRPYTREQAAYPLPYLRDHKFWPATARIDNVHGDRNIFCSCPPVEDFDSE